MFFKATGARVRGPGEAVGLRRDSRWQVPEPEVALVIGAGGRVVGYTAGNDMSCRDIEGENRSGNLGVCWIGQGFVHCSLSAAGHTPARHPLTSRTPRLESCRERSGPKPLPSGDGTSP